MRSGLAMRLIGFVAMLARAALCATGPVVTTEELFRWGEYDSLIRALEPLTQAPGYATSAINRADSSERARSLMYLGVAYYAKGRSDRADPVFRLACALDSGVEMDKFYLTPAIVAHFDSVKLEDRRERQGREVQARTARPAPGAAVAAAHGATEDIGSQKDRPALNADRSWVWWGLGTAALVAAGGGVYWYAMQSSGPRESITTLDVRGHQ